MIIDMDMHGYGYGYGYHGSAIVIIVISMYILAGHVQQTQQGGSSILRRLKTRHQRLESTLCLFWNQIRAFQETPRAIPTALPR
jgi:MFS-type transporter involved in bile tolerance (Atg22 family)